MKRRHLLAGLAGLLGAAPVARAAQPQRVVAGIDGGALGLPEAYVPLPDGRIIPVTMSKPLAVGTARSLPALPDCSRHITIQFPCGGLYFGPEERGMRILADHLSNRVARAALPGVARRRVASSLRPQHLRSSLIQPIAGMDHAEGTTRCAGYIARSDGRHDQ